MKAGAVSARAEAPVLADAPILWLRRREDHRLRNGHPWVFSNEVDIGRSPVADLAPGTEVEVRNHAGRSLGMALASPRSLICARLYSTRPGATLDRAALVARLRDALALRERYFAHPYYRLVHGESDALPGLIVDRHGDVVVAQLLVAGMERRREHVLDALEEVLAPRAVVLRNDAPSRAHEGLEEGVEVARGSDPGAVTVEENGCVFAVDPLRGQKTGWFYDQRANRAAAARLADGARVLDAFSYSGAFGVQAARAGAREVLCIDSSRGAVEAARSNAEANGVAGRIGAEVGDVFDALRALAGERRHFDLVILDPPAFVRRRKDRRAGEEAYQRLNRLAAQVLSPDGVLVSASCSFHLERARLLEAVRRAARTSGRRAQILVHGHQDADHPVLPGFPESEYLKAVVARMLVER